MSQLPARNIAVFGATGYTGKLVVEHLTRAADSRVRWGVAGRDEGPGHRLHHAAHGKRAAERATAVT